MTFRRQAIDKDYTVWYTGGRYTSPLWRDIIPLWDGITPFFVLGGA